MKRWAAAVLAIAVVGCQQTQPAGSPFAAFQPTRLPSPTTGSYGMAKNGTLSASAAPSGGSTVPQGWNGSSSGVPAATAPAASAPAATPTVGGGLGGTSAVPPTLPPTGGDAYYNPGTSSTLNGAGAAGFAMQPLPPGGAIAGVSPSGSFGVGGSFASPGTGYGAPIAGFAPQGGIATVGYDQPIANPGATVAGSTQPTYFGPSATSAGSIPATQPSFPTASGGSGTWNGGSASTSTGRSSSTSTGDSLQWRAR